MESKTDKSSDASLSALSIAMAFSRTLEMKYHYLFTEKERLLAKHLFNYSKQTISGIKWIVEESICQLPYSLQQSFFNYFIIPAHDQVILLRKLMIKHVIDNFIEKNLKQIVFLGGGYDIRAYVTAINNPQMKIFELDRGATFTTKLNGLKEIPIDFGFGNITIAEGKDGSVSFNNLCCISCDFITDNLVEILKQNGLEENEPILFIGEGLTTWFNQEANEKLLNMIKHFPNEKNETLLSYVSAKLESELFEKTFKLADESHQFILSQEQILSFIKMNGYNAVAKFDATNMLESLGNTYESEIYKCNPEKAKELYFILKPIRDNNCNFPNQLEQIESITFSIPSPPEEEMSQPWLSNW